MTHRRLLRMIAGSALLLTVGPAAAAARAPAPLRLDAYSAHLGPDTPPVASRERLRQGALYVATVQGTLSFYAAIDYSDPQLPFRRVCGTPAPAPLFASAGGSGPVGEDAQFIFAHPSATPCDGPRLPHVWSNFQASLGAGWRHPGLAGAASQTRPVGDHRYDYGLVGRGRPVRFRLVDSDTRDDYGTLEISLRRAAPSDCAGAGYRAFGLGSSAACAQRASGPRPSPSRGAHRLTVDQAPLLRVLRNGDVPSATNQELPSGALDASQLARLAGHERPALIAQASDGVVSAAVSEYRGGGLPQLTSTAVRYRDVRAARAGMRSDLRLARRLAPGGTAVSVAGVAGSTSSQVVTFTPRVATGRGGDELLQRVGSDVYGLTAVQIPDRVSLVTEAALLHRVVGRAAG